MAGEQEVESDCAKLEDVGRPYASARTGIGLFLSTFALVLLDPLIRSKILSKDKARMVKAGNVVKTS
jgi:hypothetical protein